VVVSCASTVGGDSHATRSAKPAAKTIRDTAAIFRKSGVLPTMFSPSQGSSRQLFSEAYMMPCKEASCYPPSKNSTMPHRGCDVIRRALPGETARKLLGLNRCGLCQATQLQRIGVNLDFRFM
jgi:hypothetical protein